VMTVTSYRGEPDQSDPGELDPATTGTPAFPASEPGKCPSGPAAKRGPKTGSRAAATPTVRDPPPRNRRRGRCKRRER
jgi:hypothetical protein